MMRNVSENRFQNVWRDPCTALSAIVALGAVGMVIAGGIVCSNSKKVDWSCSNGGNNCVSNSKGQKPLTGIHVWGPCGSGTGTDSICLDYCSNVSNKPQCAEQQYFCSTGAGDGSFTCTEASQICVDPAASALLATGIVLIFCVLVSIICRHCGPCRKPSAPISPSTGSVFVAPPQLPQSTQIYSSPNIPHHAVPIYSAIPSRDNTYPIYYPQPVVAVQGTVIGHTATTAIPVVEATPL